jgi:benzoyl-CoA 2,3-dioxygenase component A
VRQAKRYVQDLVIERASDVARMIVERRATIYLCGLKSMERGIRDALSEVLATTGDGWSALEGELIAAGRFHVEVY